MAEAGQPRMFAEFAQLNSGVALARGTIDLFLSMSHEESNPVPVDELVRGGVKLSIRRHEPIGVVAAITPYNGAIIMAFQKLIPALMAGNSVILRPSPLTPISSLIFGTAADAAGLPPGVLSVVVEGGAAGAELLTTDPAVDMVSFTGSTVVARQILVQAAPTVKRVALELGGKSAQIYLDDAVDRAAGGAMAVVAMTAGQACVAATRMVVPRDRKDEVLDAVSAAYAVDHGRPAERSHRADGTGHHRRAARPVRTLRRSGRGAGRQGRLRWAAPGCLRTRVLLRAARSSTCPTTPTPRRRKRSSAR